MDKFFSKEIYRLNYRGQWAFIGQKGRPLDGEHEKVGGISRLDTNQSCHV